jgi:GTP-binding protein
MSTDDAQNLAQARKLFAGPCDFVWGTASIASMPPYRLPEVAFVGRSNAGKSSLINALTNRKALARVSNTPGRTRQINFFTLGEKLMLADLPGYGYARAAKTLAAEWQTLIFAYLRGRPNLRRVMLLIDARRGVMETDRAAMSLLDQAAVSFALVLTKVDALSTEDCRAALATTQSEARTHTAAFGQIFATSARTKSGLDPLKIQIAALAEH